MSKDISSQPIIAQDRGDRTIDAQSIAWQSQSKRNEDQRELSQLDEPACKRQRSFSSDRKRLESELAKKEKDLQASEARNSNLSRQLNATILQRENALAQEKAALNHYQRQKMANQQLQTSLNAGISSVEQWRAEAGFQHQQWERSVAREQAENKRCRELETRIQEYQTALDDHARHTGSLALQLQARQRERDGALVLRDSALAQRDSAFAQRDGALAQQVAALAQRDALSKGFKEQEAMARQSELQFQREQAGLEGKIEKLEAKLKDARQREENLVERVKSLEEEQKKGMEIRREREEIVDMLDQLRRKLVEK